MPRSSKKKEQPVPKNNETTNKKRKRTEDDVDNKTSHKKIKTGWLRDIKAVLRSAGNRLAHIESESKLTRANRKKGNKYKKNGPEIDINGENKIDQGGLIENLDMSETRNGFVSQINGAINEDERNSCNFNGNPSENLAGSTEVGHFDKKHNAHNDLEESCTFQQIQCKASGTMIRLENVSSAIPQMANNIEADSCNPSRRAEAVSYEDNTTRDDLENTGRPMEAEKLLEIVDLDINNPIVREDEQDCFSAQSSIGVVKHSDKKCLNGFKNNYFFGNDNRADNSHSDTGYIFASSHNEQRTSFDSITETNEVDMEMNEIETVESQRSEDSDSNGNLTDYWITPSTGDCTAQTRYLTNEYQLPSNNNTIIDNHAVEISQEKLKFPITEAYYDSNTGAYVDPSTLQDNKAQNSSNSFKNTWGSIKSLISRVSGNKGSGDVANNQPEDMVTHTEEHLQP